jgi:hypothetical protein
MSAFSDQTAASETILRHGEAALRAGDMATARFWLALLSEEDELLGAVFAARILSEKIAATRNAQETLDLARAA